MTQQQIETMDGILEGREFRWDGAAVNYRYQNGALYTVKDAVEGDASLMHVGALLSAIERELIQLVPQPPEPLSDEMGELLWGWVNSLGARPCDHRKKLEGVGLIDEYGWVTVPKGERGLGEYLMRKNGGQPNV